MCSGNTCGSGIGLFDVFIQFNLWVVSVILLWRIFDDEDWPGWAAIVPIFNTVVVVVIATRTVMWALKNVLKEVILIAVLTIVCIILIPAVSSSSPTLSGFIKLIPPSILGGYLLARKLGSDEYNLYVPAAVTMFCAVFMIGLFIFLMILAFQILGAEKIQEILSDETTQSYALDADMMQDILSMGIFMLIVSTVASVPCFFVCGVIGGWIGEKIRVRFSKAGPLEGYEEIRGPSPSKPVIDTSVGVNSPLRFRARDAAEEPTAEEKPPDEMTILEKLKT
jgi:hypothetical protein